MGISLVVKSWSGNTVASGRKGGGKHQLFSHGVKAPSLHDSITRSLRHSSTPSLHHSITPVTPSQSRISFMTNTWSLNTVALGRETQALRWAPNAETRIADTPHADTPTRSPPSRVRLTSNVERVNEHKRDKQDERLGISYFLPLFGDDPVGRRFQWARDYGSERNLTTSRDKSDWRPARSGGVERFEK